MGRGLIAELVLRGFAQTSRERGVVARVKPEHFGREAWRQAHVNPAETVTLTPREMAEFRALGGPTASRGWDGRPPGFVDPEPIAPAAEHFAGLGWNAAAGDPENFGAVIAESLRLQGEVLVQIRDLLAALVEGRR